MELNINSYRKDVWRKDVMVVPEFLYSVREAMIFFGVHRTSIYRYMNNSDNPLEAIRFKHDRMILFRGATLIAYKTNGLPKRGRRRKKCVPIAPMKS